MSAKTNYALASLDSTHTGYLYRLKRSAETGNEAYKKELRAVIRGYLVALNNAGMISDSEYRTLYCYFTINL